MTRGSDRALDKAQDSKIDTGCKTDHAFCLYYFQLIPVPCIFLMQGLFEIDCRWMRHLSATALVQAGQGEIPVALSAMEGRQVSVFVDLSGVPAYQ